MELLAFGNCKIILENVVKKHLKERFLRHQAAQRDESEQIVIGQSHLYRVMDTELTSLIQENHPEAFGICIVLSMTMIKGKKVFVLSLKK